MNHTWNEIAAQVRVRAGHRCEYCKMHQNLQGASFHIEHILPESRGGLSDLANLALACVSCNLHKSDLVELVDSVSGNLVPLFNPRTDPWETHYCWRGYMLEGLTAVGRATIEKLDLNSARRLQIRQAEEMFGLFPP